MKFKKLLGALAVTSAFVGGAANAAPFIMDVAAFGSAGAGDANTTTSLIHGLGLAWSATSTYTDNLSNTNGGVGTLNKGDFVSDSGNGTVTLRNSANQNISGANNTEGLLSAYSLTFSYVNLMGIVDIVLDPGPLPSAIGAIYNSGLIDVFANLIDGDGNVSLSTNIMKLEVTGSTGTIGNFRLFTKVLSVADNVFSFNGSTDFFDIFNITSTTNFNNPPVKVVNGPGVNPQQWSRTTPLNGEMKFEVPEPGILALLGLGLVGIGFARRNKKQA